jgi:hypothetical protein
MKHEVMRGQVRMPMEHGEMSRLLRNMEIGKMKKRKLGESNLDVRSGTAATRLERRGAHE